MCGGELAAGFFLARANSPFFHACQWPLRLLFRVSFRSFFRSWDFLDQLAFEGS